VTAILESGLLLPLLAAFALLIAIVVVVRALTSAGGERHPNRKALQAAPRRVEPHLYAERGRGEDLPTVQRPARQATTTRRSPGRRGFGWTALSLAFILGGGVGVVTGGLINAPGWDAYRPYSERALAAVDSAGRQALAAAEAGLARVSQVLDGSSSSDEPASPPLRRVEVVPDDDTEPADERSTAVAAFVDGVELPLAVSPAIELVKASARNGNLELTMRLKRVVRDRDRSLFVLTANERTRDIICDDTETAAIRALSDANVGIAVTYVDADNETIYEIDVLGGHCGSGQSPEDDPA